MIQLRLPLRPRTFQHDTDMRHFRLRSGEVIGEVFNNVRVYPLHSAVDHPRQAHQPQRIIPECQTLQGSIGAAFGASETRRDKLAQDFAMAIQQLARRSFDQWRQMRVHGPFCGDVCNHGIFQPHGLKCRYKMVVRDDINIQVAGIADCNRGFFVAASTQQQLVRIFPMMRVAEHRRDNRQIRQTGARHDQFGEALDGGLQARIKQGHGPQQRLGKINMREQPPSIGIHRVAGYGQ